MKYHVKYCNRDICNSSKPETNCNCWKGVKHNMTEYILLNDETGTFETFSDEDELVEFLKDEEFSPSELREIRVFSVDTEYEVTPSYELEEV